MTRMFVIASLAGSLLFSAAAAQQPPEFQEAYRTYTTLMAEGKEREAIPFASKALEIAVASDAFDDETRGKLAFNLGFALFQNHRPSDAVDAFSTAISLLEKAEEPNRALIGEALVYRGIVYRILHKGREAEEDLKRALELLTNPAPVVQIIRAEAYENLAWATIQQGKYRSARDHADEAYALYTKYLPEGHPRTLRVLVVISAAAFVGGRSIEARNILAQAISQAEKRGLVPEGQDARTDAGQFTLTEFYRFHRDVAQLYELMKRDADAEYHRNLASALAEGLRPPALRVKPIERRPPRYPRRASNRGLQGWVLAEYTVRKDGSTADVRIVDAAPEGFFENAVLVAIKGWKYEPPIEDGEPVDVSNVRTMIQFALEN